MARRSKYTDDVVQRLTDAIRLGATYAMACSYAGITFETFNQWRNAKPAFSDLVKEAEGDAVVQWLTKIEQAANDGNWQAAAWKLERRYPHDYGRTVHEQQQSGELTIRVQYGDRDDSA